jgi:hypothetical protein
MKHFTFWKRFLVFLIITGMGAQLLAQIPATPSVQMLLTDNSGKPVSNGSYNITVSLYNVLTGGSALWSESQNTMVTDGLANIEMGKSNPLNLIFNQQYFVGITIGSGSELSPRLPLNPSTYSLSARAVYGSSNIFPEDGNVGIGTLQPKAKLDVEGQLRISDVNVTTLNKPNVLVHDSSYDQMVKQMPFDSLLAKVSGPGVVGPPGPMGPAGPMGPPGPAGGAGEPGKDLIVKDSTGNEVFRVNAIDGTSRHKGREVFEGGLVVAKDDSTGAIELFPDGKLAIYDSTGLEATVFYPDGTSWHREIEDYEGGIVVGHRDSNYLWINDKGEIGIYDSFGMPAWEVKSDGTSKHYGLETYYEGIKVPMNGGIFTSGGISLDPSKGLLITGLLGDTVTSFGFDGKSYHKGFEEYAGGIKVGAPDSSYFWVGKNGEYGVVKDGKWTSHVWPDGTSFHHGTEQFTKGIFVGAPDSSYFKVGNNGEFGIIKDGKWTSHFLPDGTSFHNGPEQFTKEIRVGAPDSSYFKVGNNGEFGIIKDGKWKTRFQPDGKSFHYGREQFEEGLVVGKPGGSYTGINPDGTIQIVSSDGKVMTQFKPDGTSLHSGLETFAGGIEIPLTGGGKVVISKDPNIGLAIFDAAGNYIQHVRGDGAAYHSKDLTVGGTITAKNLNVTGEKHFMIDHPLDPQNKYLIHRSIESNDRLNFYNGNVKLDKNGEAIVTLPDWFEELNEEFRYQLTAIGAPGPNLFVSNKISNNQFKISGGTKEMEVSWQVTGNRKDKYANGVPPEVEIFKESTSLSSGSVIK